MRMSILDYKDVFDITPTIEHGGLYSITIRFTNGECCVYGYADKSEFTNDYKFLSDSFAKFGG